jgi:hypothetical protein
MTDEEREAVEIERYNAMEAEYGPSRDKSLAELKEEVRRYFHYRQVLTGRYRGCTASEAMLKFNNEIRDTTSDLYLAILFFAEFIKRRADT